MHTAGVRCCCAIRVNPYTSGLHALSAPKTPAQGHAKLPAAAMAVSSKR